MTDNLAGSITSVVINGVSATMAVKSTTAPFRNNEVWYARVPTGTSVTITFTRDATSGTNLRWVTIYRAVSTVFSVFSSAAAYNANTGVSPLLSVNLDSPNPGFIVGSYGYGAGTVGDNATWSASVTKAYQEVSTFVMFSSAYANISSAGTKTVSATSTDTSVNRPGLAVAAFNL